MECVDFLELRREVVEEVYYDLIHREQIFRMLAIEATEKACKRYGHKITEIEMRFNFYRQFRMKEYFLIVKCEIFRKN